MLHEAAHRTALTDLSTRALVELASARRDALFGTRVTYSPKVSITLSRAPHNSGLR